MAFTCNIYAFDKKLNSTARPAASTPMLGTSCELKAPTSVYMPVMVFDDLVGEHDIDIVIYTYAYIPEFKRYYFITNWTYNAGRWVASMECDTLATFKNEIGATTAYVLRAANACDPNIIDGKLTTVATSDRSDTMSFDHVTSPWKTSQDVSNAAYSNGYYRVAIANDDSAAIGSISYYAFSPAAMRELFDKLYASPTWMGITDTSLSADLQKLMFNPIQYIVDIMWIPMSFDTSGLTSTQSIPIGWWSISLTTNSCYKITSSRMAQGSTVTFTNFIHPQQTDTYHDWLSLAPYTRYCVEFQPFGMFELDSTKIYGAYGIELEYYVDLMTGRGLLTTYRTDLVGGIVTRSNCPLYSCSAQVGIPISVAQMSVDMSALSSVSTWTGATAIAGLTGDLVEHVSQFGSNLGALAHNVGAAAKEFGTEIMSGVSLKSAVSTLGENIANQFNSVGTTGTNAGGSLLSSMKEIAADILPAAVAAAGVCTQQGSNGGFAMLRRDVRFVAYYQLIAAQDNDHYGRPVCQSMQISSISGGGFILCANEGNLVISGTQLERQAVTAFMTGGFYYE